MTLILAFSVQDALIYACFKINQTNIAELFCVNKLKPTMDCHGHCFLTQKITEQKDQEQKMPFTSAQEHVQVLVWSPCAHFRSDFNFHTAKTSNFSYHNEAGLLWNEQPLRPPTV